MWEAANGDKVFATYENSGCTAEGVSESEATGNAIIAGGTGRFAGATGEASFSGVVATDSYQITAKGTITH